MKATGVWATTRSMLTLRPNTVSLEGGLQEVDDVGKDVVVSDRGQVLKESFPYGASQVDR